MREKLLSLIKTKTFISDKIDDFEKKKTDVNRYTLFYLESLLIPTTVNSLQILMITLSS
jgi:hypothetical protein